MSNLKFRTVMAELGIKNLREDNKEKEIRCSFDGVNIGCQEDGSIYVRGNIPYEVALLMAKGYPELRNQIIPFGSQTNTKSEVVKSKKTTKDNKNVIKGYSDISSEALLILLTELEYYHQHGIYTEELRKKFKTKQRETIDSYGRHLTEMYYSMIGYTKEEWRANNLASNYSDLEAEIVPYMEELSKSINPFSNGQYSINSIEDLNKGLKFSCRNSYAEQDGCGFSLKGDDGTTLYCEVGIDSQYPYFAHKIKFISDDGDNAEIESLIDKTANLIIFNVYNKNCDKIDFTYDLTKGEIINYNDVANQPITQEQIDVLKLYLEQANMRAKTLNENRFYTPSKRKSLN